MLAVGAVNGRTMLHVTLTGTNPRRGNRVHELDSVLPGINRNFADNGANLVRRRRCRNGLAKGNRHGTVRRRAVHVGAAIAVVGAPKALNVERDNHCIGLVDSRRIVNGKGFHVRGLGHLACGEYDHGFTLQKILMDFVHGLFGVIVVNTDHAQTLEDCAQVPLFKVVLVACNAKRTGGCHLQHGPVDKAVVVTHQKHGTFVRNILHAKHANAVAVEHQLKKRAEQRLRQVRNGPYKHHQRYDGDSEEVQLRTDVGVMDH